MDVKRQTYIYIYLKAYMSNTHTHTHIHPHTLILSCPYNVKEKRKKYVYIASRKVAVLTRILLASLLLKCFMFNVLLIFKFSMASQTPVYKWFDTEDGN